VRAIVSSLATIVALAIFAPAAVAATGTVEVRESAVSIEGGRSVLVFVEVQCSLEPGEELLEGNVSVSQDDASGLAGLDPTCNGRPRVYPVRVTSFGGTFESGDAFASAFLLFLDPATGRTTSLSDSTIVTIR
jgi:hypothetical protein